MPINLDVGRGSLRAKFACGSALAALMSLLQPSTAYGQDSEGKNAEVEGVSTTPGEIIVTAQRRSEKAQNVGIAIAAFSGDTLKERGVATSSDIAALTPGVNLSGTYGGQSVQFSIRGVTQSDFNDAIEGPVAVYVDDIYIASQQGQSMALFDLARVEALKGPQGTLFGRNATGGLVHMVVQTPKLAVMEGHLGAFAGGGGILRQARPDSRREILLVAAFYGRARKATAQFYPAMATHFEGVWPNAPILNEAERTPKSLCRFIRFQHGQPNLCGTSRSGPAFDRRVN